MNRADCLTACLQEPELTWIGIIILISHLASASLDIDKSTTCADA